jgi:archaellum component FlaC
MEDNLPLGYLMVIINGILLGLVVFFLKQILGKFASMESTMRDLAISIATLGTTQQHHDKQLEDIDRTDERFEKEIKSLRERMHDFGNSLNQVVGKHELLEERCKSHRERYHSKVVT